MSNAPIRSMALAILHSDTKLTRSAGSFLGQCAVDDTPLTEKQAKWLAQLADKAGLPMETSNGE